MNKYLVVTPDMHIFCQNEGQYNLVLFCEYKLLGGSELLGPGPGAAPDQFTRDLIQHTLPLVPKHLGLKRQDYTTASKAEVFRVYRAMYRSQLCCTLLGYMCPNHRYECWDLESFLFRNFFDVLLP